MTLDVNSLITTLGSLQSTQIMQIRIAVYVSILTNALLCFFGYKVYRILMALLGVEMGFLVTALSTDGNLVYSVIAGLIVGVLFYFLFYVFVFVWGLWLGMLLVGMMPLEEQVRTIAALLAGVAIGILCVILFRSYKMIITAILGASGLATYLSPYLTAQTNVTDLLESAGVTQTWIPYMAITAIFAILGIIVQHALHKREQPRRRRRR